MVTLHPFVYYYKDEGQICHGNFVLISDCNTQDTVAVHLFRHRLINHLEEKFQFVSNIVYFSDGCAGQYRNLKTFGTYVFMRRILIFLLNGISLLQVMDKVHQMELEEPSNARQQKLVFSDLTKIRS